MKNKLLQIRVDEDCISKIECLQKINGFKSTSETVRKIIEKEFRKEEIQKQIPKKPVVSRGLLCCGNCYSDISLDGYFCIHCGQAIDWQD